MHTTDSIRQSEPQFNLFGFKTRYIGFDKAFLAGAIQLGPNLRLVEINHAW